MNAPVNDSPQARLKELQAIPDNQKTEAQWDELIELEIALAQGGRMLNSAPKANKPPHKANPAGGNGANGAKPHGGGGGQAKKHPRRFQKRPPKPAPA